MLFLITHVLLAMQKVLNSTKHKHLPRNQLHTRVGSFIKPGGATRGGANLLARLLGVEKKEWFVNGRGWPQFDSTHEGKDEMMQLWAPKKSVNYKTYEQTPAYLSATGRTPASYPGKIHSLRKLYVQVTGVVVTA